MNRADLAARITTRTSMSKAGTDASDNAVFSAIADAFAHGFAVRFGGFATFSAKSRPVHQGRNPRTGQSTAMAVSNAPTFKAAKAIRTALS